MRGNILGKMVSMTTFGESHGVAMGVVLDGIPAGISFSLGDLQKELDKRAPGRLKGTTARKEPDLAEILSGVKDDLTLGTPIAVIVRNVNFRSSDYDKLKEDYRPGHADKTTLLKFGIRDHRGGGRSSGRETIARVIAGYFAGLITPQVKVTSYISKMGKFKIDTPFVEKSDIDLGPYFYPDKSKWDEIANYLEDLRKKGESVGGRVSIIIENCPVGLGEPSFDKLKADFAKGLLSIGACTSFSYGLGEEFGQFSGTEVSTDSSNFGGMEGGISNGERITMQITFKPTSTVGDKAKQGRHDPCVIPRAIPVVNAMVKFILSDHYLRQQAYDNSN